MIALVMVAAMLVLVDTAVGAAPANDHYANATAFGTAPGQVVGTNVDATRQTGEPDNGNRTVWWKWTAPDSGRYRLDTCDTIPALRTVVGVYHGPNVTALQSPILVDARCTDSSLDALAFDAVAGTTYRFSVGSYYNSETSLNLRLSLRRTPVNDNFAAAYDFAPAQGTVTGPNLEATRELGEPDNGNATIWWRWVAPFTDNFKLDTCATVPPLSTVIGIYTGSAVSQLQEPIHEADSCPGGEGLTRTSFDATAGQTYFLSVGSYYSSESSQNLALAVISKTCQTARRDASGLDVKVGKLQDKVKKAKERKRKAKSKRARERAKDGLKKAKSKLRTAKGALADAEGAKATYC